MNKLFRIILSLIFTACAIALFYLCYSLVVPVVNWALLIPVAIVGIGLLYIAWLIVSGASWRDVMDFMADTFYWR